MAVALVLFALVAAPVVAVDQGSAVVANPIRKVVTMLQNMEKKVRAEGEKEKELYDKFMCYCKNAGGDLAKNVADNEAKLGQLPSQIKAGEANKKQLDADLKNHQADRTAAKAAIASATSLREKEAASFAKESAELT